MTSVTSITPEFKVPESITLWTMWSLFYYTVVLTYLNWWWTQRRRGRIWSSKLKIAQTSESALLWLFRSRFPCFEVQHKSHCQTVYIQLTWRLCRRCCRCWCWCCCCRLLVTTRCGFGMTLASADSCLLRISWTKYMSGNRSRLMIVNATKNPNSIGRK